MRQRRENQEQFRGRVVAQKLFSTTSACDLNEIVWALFHENFNSTQWRKEGGREKGPLTRLGYDEFFFMCLPQARDVMVLML